MHRVVINRAKTSTAPTYLYRFSFSSFSFGTKKLFVGKNVTGACHADDVSYVFKTILSKVPKRSTREWKTIERMCECFTMFALTGNPNNDVIAPLTWAPIELSHNDAGQPLYKCLDINEDISFIETPELERMLFWEKLHQELKCQQSNSISCLEKE